MFSSRCSVEIPKTGEDGSSTQVITTEADLDNAVINFNEREAKFVNNEFDNRNDEDNESDNETDDHYHQENQPTKSWRFGQESNFFVYTSFHLSAPFGRDQYNF